MKLTHNGTTRLDVEDFRRLGVRPNECRLTVIRRAAARSAKLLAEQQLNTPNPQIELQLALVATSTYRLLDPRKREDVYQRAYVGRILPNALLWAGRTHFHGGGGVSSPASTGIPFRSRATSDAELVEMLDLSPGESIVSNQPDAWTRSLNTDDLIRTDRYRRRSHWLRRQLSRPATVLALMAMLTATTYWIANRSGQANRLTVRRVPSAIDETLRRSAGVELPVGAATIDPNRLAKSDHLDGELPAPVTDVADADAVVADSDVAAKDVAATIADVGRSASAAGVEVAESDQLLPAKRPAIPTAPVEGSQLVEANAAVPPASPMEVETVVPAADVPPTVNDLPWSESLASDEPTFDILAVRQWDSFVASFQGYALDVLNSDVWSAVPIPDADEKHLESGAPGARDVVDASAKLEIPASKTEIPEVMPPSVEIAGTERAVEPTPRYSLPTDDESALAREQWATLEPALTQTMSRDEAVTLIQRITEATRDLEGGTADHFVAGLIAAEAAWTVDEPPSVRSRLQLLVAEYETELNPLLASSFVGATKLAESSETHERLLTAGLTLAQQFLLDESFDECDTVLTAVRGSADLLEDPAATAFLDQCTESASQMERQAASMTSIINADGEIVADTMNDKIGIAGRYYCLMLRRWETGLPWLVEATDARISGLAERERLLTAEATDNELSELAELWLAAASRATGRASDSMRLHAIELLRRASQQSSGLKKLERTRAIERIQQLLPSFVRESAVEVLVPSASAESMSSSESLFSGESRLVTAQASPNPPWGTGFVGRLRSEGQDVGVQLIYEPGVLMSDVVIEQISERLEQSLESFEIEFEGRFELGESASVKAVVAQVPDATQAIWIDGSSLDLDEAEASLEPGSHQIRWTIETAKIASAFLRVHEVGSDQEIEIAPPEAASDEQLPTSLTVKMVRRSE